VDPVAPVAPAEASVIDSTAGWLVVTFSLLSRAILTMPSPGEMRKPLLVVPFSQLCTAAVASTDRYIPLVETLTPLAKVAPAVGELLPFTPASVQAPFAAEIPIVPASLTLLTNSVRVAFETLLAVVPPGKAVRSN
jgi:hypothetical protein